jgi:SPP1 gp7 family putative phage head morphogenesis protein
MNKHQKLSQNALDRLERSYEKELIRNYQIALKELRAKISLVYENYNGSWVEMQKYNRLAKLEQEIAQEISKLTGLNAMTLKKGMMGVYEESYYRTAWVLSTMVQADLGYSVLNRELVQKAIENPLDRVGFLQRNRDNHALLTKQLREQLTQALIQGEAYGTAAKRIKERMDVGATNVIRIAQTEMHRTRQQAKYDGMVEGEKAGITLKKMWVSTIDSRTRDRHQHLDGKQVDVDEPFKAGQYEGLMPGMFGIPSMDINCRCTTIEVVEGFEPNSRRVKGVGITNYATYNEFKEKGLVL